MCMGNHSESGHGAQFKPCKMYKELRDKCHELERKCGFTASEKGPAKDYHIYLMGNIGHSIIVSGWYRRDLEKPNWHYYEDVDGSILHVRKEHMICVVEKEIKDASDE